MKVKGYHGTTSVAAKSLLNGADFLLSKNEGDWLGSGVYFFQDAPLRAMWWAEKIAVGGVEPVVLEAEIDLADSLDLLDLWGFDELRRSYEQFEKLVDTPDQQPLELYGGKTRMPPAGTRLVDRNKRDCALVDYTVSAMEAITGENVSSVRSAFLWGKAVYTQSFLFDWNNVQIAVRNTAAISSLRPYVPT